MNTNSAKKAAVYLCEEWCLPYRGKLFDMLGLLEKGISQEHSESSAFELSFIPGKKEIRLLSLFFPSQGINNSDAEKVTGIRVRSINNAFEYANTAFKLGADIHKLGLLIKLFRYTGWPFQFGIKLNRKHSKVTLYVSITDYQNMSFRRKAALLRRLKRVCAIINVDWSLVKAKFGETKFDVIAIDFLPNKCHTLKIYSCYDDPGLHGLRGIYNSFVRESDSYNCCPIKNKPLRDYFLVLSAFPVRSCGVLYRIERSKIKSLKLWARFQAYVSSGRFLGLSRGSSLLDKDYLRFISRICNISKSRISYVTLERNMPNIYIR